MFNSAPIDVIYLHAADNVCVAARDLPAGTRISAGGAHGRAARAGQAGTQDRACADRHGRARSVKYGQTIGFATEDIAPGHVDSHAQSDGRPVRPRLCGGQRRFRPSRRRSWAARSRATSGPDRRAGTRNYIAVISTVNCSASVSKYVAARFNADALKAYPNVDGVVAFTHGGGCGMQFGGEGHATLNRVMGGIARHPNIGGYVLIGLGCETATLGYLLDDQKLVQIGGTGQATRGDRPC